MPEIYFRYLQFIFIFLISISFNDVEFLIWRHSNLEVSKGILDSSVLETVIAEREAEYNYFDIDCY